MTHFRTLNTCGVVKSSLALNDSKLPLDSSALARSLRCESIAPSLAQVEHLSVLDVLTELYVCSETLALALVASPLYSSRALRRRQGVPSLSFMCSVNNVLSRSLVAAMCVARIVSRGRRIKPR